MTWRRALLSVVTILLTLFPGTAGAQTSPNQGQPRFRSAVDVVSVTAVVRDRKGRFVRDLLPKDFVVAEAGEAERILDFPSEADRPGRLAPRCGGRGRPRGGGEARAGRG